MTEEKYNTKDIRHIDENSQEYIAEGNRMIKEIINSDGSRNWQANILLDNIKRLEQENKELREKAPMKLIAKNNTYRSALEEINKIAELRFVNGLNEEADLCNLAMNRIQNKINEVLK